MAKIAIVYASVHHKNTEKLVNGIAASVEMDIYDVNESAEIDFTKYDAVGLASGIYAYKMHKDIVKFASEKELPEKVFVIYTAGNGSKKLADRFVKKLESSGHKVLGVFSCKAWDSFGPFKLIGGINKGLPDENSIKGGVEFLKNEILTKLN